MDLKKWKLEFKPGWDVYFKKFDRTTQNLILKKLKQMKQPLKARGLYSSRYQVEEVNQFRIVFIQDEKIKTKKIHFIGNHMQYEKWYSD